MPQTGTKEKALQVVGNSSSEITKFKLTFCSEILTQLTLEVYKEE